MKSRTAMRKAKKHILIVEDDLALSDAFSTVLRKEGFTVTCVFNGQEALDLLKHDRVDLILLDIIMPVMDGTEFLRHYTTKTKKPPIIVFSNLDSQNHVSEVYKLGASHYMLKAWASPKELVRIVKRTLGS